MSFDTMEVERHLLKLVTTDNLVARRVMLRLKVEWFGGIRKSIFEIVSAVFNSTPTLLTNELFEIEVAKLFPDAKKQKADRDKLITEWTLIQGATAPESAEALIEKLQEKARIDAVTGICSQTLEFLKNGSIEDAVSLLKTESVQLDSSISAQKPSVNLTDIAELDQHIEDVKTNPAQYSGIPTGFDRFDLLTGGLFKAELFLVSAVTGVGKSTFLKMLGRNIMMGDPFHKDPSKRRIGKNVLHVTNEEHRDQVHMKYSSLFSQIDYFKFKNATIDDTERAHWRAMMKDMQKDDYGRIFIKEITQFSSVSEIYQEYMELEQRGINIDIIIIDYMDHLSPMQKAWGENDEQAKVAWDCKGLCIDLNVPVATATQASTITETKQEKGSRFGKLDVYGSKRRVHAANTFVGIMKNSSDLSQLSENGGDRETDGECDRFWTGEVVKSRDGACFSWEMRHKVLTGEVVDELWSKGGSVATKSGATSLIEEGKIICVEKGEEEEEARPPSIVKKPVQHQKSEKEPEKETKESPEKEPVFTSEPVKSESSEERPPIKLSEEAVKAINEPEIVQGLDEELEAHSGAENDQNEAPPKISGLLKKLRKKS